MVARSILVHPDFAAVSSNGADFNYSPHGDAIIPVSTTDTYYYCPPISLTIERLAVYEGVAASGTGKTFKALLNGSASSLVVSIADGGAVGTITSDNVDTVSLVAGNRLSFVGSKTGGGNMAVGHRAVIVAPGLQSVSPLVSTSGGSTFDSSTRTYPVSGAISVVTYAADARMTLRCSGDWRGLFVHVTSNTGSASSTIRGLLNGVDTAMLVTIGVGETGQFFDNTNVISVVSGDHLNYRKTGSTGTSYSITTIGSSIVASDRKQQIYGYASRSWSVSIMNGTAHTGLPGPDYGNTVTSTSYSAYERTLGYPARISSLQTAAANTLDVSVTCTLYVNDVATALTVTIPSGTTLVENLVNTIDVTPTDKLGFKWATVGTATTGTFNARSWSIIVEDTTAQFKPKISWSR